MVSREVYMSSKKWLLTFLILYLAGLLYICGTVIYLDPFFHYHKPIDGYYYVLENERSQNDGIIKHFDYDAIIIGTSMTENFKTSELDSLFGVNSIKVPFFGATYYEINTNLEKALKNNNEIRLVVRALDLYGFNEDSEQMRNDLGVFPTYLYDDNLINDVNYIFNRDVLYNWCLNMQISKTIGDNGGITSFDKYANWCDKYNYGKKYALEGIEAFEEPYKMEELNIDEREEIIDNIDKNVISLAKDYPNVEFYYYLPPYSSAWWGVQYSEGKLDKQIESEQLVIEMIVKVPNIHLYSWNDQFEITTNLNNYKDKIHYGEWVNSMILKDMKEGKGVLTSDNYKEYISKIRNYYNNFDFNSLF